MFTIERWRGRVVREVFCVVGERLLKVEAKVGKILHILVFWGRIMQGMTKVLDKRI